MELPVPCSQSAPTAAHPAPSSIPLGAEMMAGLFCQHRETHELHLPLELLPHLLINVIHHLTDRGERALPLKEEEEYQQRDMMPRRSLLQQVGFAGIR